VSLWDTGNIANPAATSTSYTGSMTTWHIILIAWLAPALIIVAVGLYMRFKARDRSYHRMSDPHEGEELPDADPVRPTDSRTVSPN